MSDGALLLLLDLGLAVNIYRDVVNSAYGQLADKSKGCFQPTFYGDVVNSAYGQLADKSKGYFQPTFYGDVEATTTSS